jgi:ankyrin repeat protein
VIDNDGWNVLMNVLANPSRYKRQLDEDTIMKMVNILTEKVIDINYEAPDGMNALSVALLCGKLDVAKKIKEMMKKPEPSTNKGPKLSALSCLCLARVEESDIDAQKELIGELLDAGYDALAQDDKGQNALHIACLYRRFDLAKELITRCKNATDLLSAKDHQGYTPLHYAVTLYAKAAPEWSYDGKALEDITEKLRKYYSYFESHDIEVRLDDLIAAVSGVETVKDSVFDEISTNGETLLHLLCRSYQNDKAPVVKQLLFHSANPDVQDKYGQTPLLISCFNLDVKVVKKLLKRKVNVNAADMHGVTPALALCYGVNREIEDLHHYQLNSYRVKGEVEVLIQKTKERVIASFREIFALLAKHNADFTMKDKLIWRTTLHMLAGSQIDVSDLIEQLVKEFKVDINVRDIRNDSALHFAVRKYNTSHLRKLLELGADINAIGSRGLTPLHALFKLTDYSSFKGNGEIMKGGFKIFGHSLVYYPSWIWNSVEEGLPSLDRNRYSVKTDTEEKELIDKMVLVMFEYADKIDFGIKDAEGSLPLHLVCDIWREEDNLSPIFTNSPLVKKLLTPVQLKLPLPNLFLKYATKEHICTIGPWNQSAFERLSRVLQIFQAPFEVPKETAIQFMEDVLAKGVDFSIFGDDIVSHFTSARDVWPEVLDILLQHTPSSVYESVFQTRANSTAMHNCLGIRPETRSCVRKTAAVLMKYAPKLLNAYDGQGRTPLMEAIERNTYSTSEEFVTKLSLAIAVLLEQPGIEVNKKHRDTGRTALHYAAYYTSYASLVGLFYNNVYLYNNIGIDNALVALLDAGADVTIKDNEGKTPLDILPALEQIAKERRKILLREEKVSLIDKPVIMIDTKNQQNIALVKAFNIDKLHTYTLETEEEDAFDLFN